MTLTQLTESITKNSWARPVRGERLVTERTEKIRKSPKGLEEILGQGWITPLPGSPALF